MPDLNLRFLDEMLPQSPILFNIMKHSDSVKVGDLPNIEVASAGHTLVVI